LAIALVIGVYLIATTVLIAKDGVFYIERAQQLSSDPINIIKRHPPGYPFLILMTHKLVTLFSNNSSVFTWIYSAQSITLLCWLLALIPLYFIGKLLVGSKNSFWALLILIFLPFPTRIVCDVVREWPYLLFLATGFFLLLSASKKSNLWGFGLAGLVSGIGYMIRPECVQIILYGIAWLLGNMLWSNRKISKVKLWLAMLLLTGGFLIPVVPYVKTRGEVLPAQIKELISRSGSNQLDKTTKTKIQTNVRPCHEAGLFPGKILKGVGRLINSICEAMMYVFVPFWVLGLYSYFRGKNWHDPKKFYVSLFIFCTCVIFVWLYCKRGRNSARHILPLISLTIFYVSIGFHIATEWLTETVSPKYTTPLDVQNKRWFCILLIISIGICLPKLTRPIRIEKKEYKTVSNWLKQNTEAEDIIAVFDRRVSFYAERHGKRGRLKRVPKGVDYIVKIFKEGEKILPRPRRGTKIKSVYALELDRNDRRIVIYKILPKKNPQ